MFKKTITFLIDGKEPITMSYFRWNITMTILMGLMTFVGWYYGREFARIDFVKERVNEFNKKVRENNRYIQITN